MTCNVSVPLVGIDGNDTVGFDALHLTALSSIMISTSASIVVIFYMFCTRKKHLFWKWYLGERLVIYLAIIDIGWGINHGADHLIIYTTKCYPPHVLCVFKSFMFSLFMTSQSLLVCFAACYGFLLVLKQKRLHLGKYDYRLLLGCLLPPIVIGSILVPFNIYGHNGSWCHIALSNKPIGPIIYSIYSSMIIIIMIINSICYISIWVTIKRSQENVAKFADNSDHKQSNQHIIQRARIMSLIVAAYFCQWTAFVIYTVLSYVGKTPPLWSLITKVIFCNAGGIFNAIAYTFMKERYQRIKHSSVASATRRKLSLDSALKSSDYT